MAISVSKNNKKINGVNLGGWLVFEKWITPSLFEGTDAEDEFNLQKQQSKDVITNHYKNFIKEEDFKFLSENGINAVRIPVGYWIFDDFSPFLGNIEYLDFAFNMAEKYGLKVLIDLHAAPGSQNGYDHSGKIGDINWDKNPESIKLTLKIIEKLAERYCERECLFGIELLNEPHISIDIDLLKNYYEEGYKIVRKYCGKEVAVVISDSFRPSDWDSFMTAPDFENVILDTHFYQCFTKENEGITAKEFLIKAKTKWSGIIKKAQKSKPIISGEWSLGINSSDFKQLSSLNSLYKEEFQSACRKFGEVQMKIFGRSLGWFFWTYKTETNTPYGWNFKGLVEEGNIKVKNYSDNLLARVLDFFS